MNTALEYSTRVAQEGGRRCKKSALNDLVHLTPLRTPLMNPPHESRFLVSALLWCFLCSSRFDWFLKSRTFDSIAVRGTKHKEVCCLV
jgi:hypothetical protein